MLCLTLSCAFLGLKSVFDPPIDVVRDVALVSLSATPVILAVVAYVARLHAKQQNLVRDATTDALTGLMNRRAFFEAVKQCDDGLLLIIDIDHFKDVNDRYGHAVGDAVLNSVGEHLLRNIRSSDLVCRMGGEEFGLYLLNADSFEADEIGARICRGYVLCNEAVPLPVKVEMSAGGAFSAMSPGFAELYRRADQALYNAKRSGRARTHFWQPNTTSRF